MLMRIGPYGTGNMSFGNFDFDPKFYPDPKGFIENLTAAGFDFQVGHLLCHTPFISNTCNVLTFQLRSG